MYEQLLNEKVVIGTYGVNTVDFDMEFLLFDVGKNRTNFKMIIKADMNPIMASMASSSMEELKDDFLKESQFWIMYFNNRSHMGLNSLTPKEKLESLGYCNADAICNFPTFILEDYYKPLSDFFDISSYYVLTHYLEFKRVG